MAAAKKDDTPKVAETAETPAPKLERGPSSRPNDLPVGTYAYPNSTMAERRAARSKKASNKRVDAEQTETK